MLIAFVEEADARNWHSSIIPWPYRSKRLMINTAYSNRFSHSNTSGISISPTLNLLRSFSIPFSICGQGPTGVIALGLISK